MKISRVRIGAFGRLEGFDTGPDPLPRLVVLLGPNEAGKSTLFHFLTTALYGFHPASREGNPYLPWGTDEAGGEVDLRLDDGTCVQVARRLRSQPSGKIASEGRTDDLRNQPLPWTAHVPYAVFSQVFAVTLQDLAGLNEDTWAGIQDRLVGAMGATDLEPPRQVVAEMEGEAGALWRPNRRGNQQIRDIQDEIRALRSRRGEALDRDRRLRDIVRERDRARSRLEEVRRERHRQRAAVERVQSLVPIRAQLRRIAALRDDAGPPELLRALPSDPDRRLTELHGQARALERRLEELTADLVEPRESQSALGERERSLLGRSDEIGSFLARAAGSSVDRARLKELEQGVTEVERRLEAASLQVLTAPWTELPPGALDAVPPADLRTRVHDYTTAREERRILEAALHQEAATAAGQRPPSSLAGSLAVLVSGAALLVLGLVSTSAVAVALGGAATAVGIAFLWLWNRHRRITPSDAGAGSALPLAVAEEARALQSVHGLVAALPLLPSAVQEPGELLVAGLERLRELLEDHRGRRAAIQDILARTAADDGDAAALAAALELDGDLSTEAVVHVLDREIRRAERLKEAADAGSREIRRLEREQQRVQSELEEVHREADALTARLSEMGDGDARRGGQLAATRLQAALRADELQDELERAHPDLDEIKARIADAEATGESWTVDDDDLARRKAAIESLDEELERLAKSAEALDRDALHMQQEETVDAVDGEIGSLQEEEARLIRDRDRKWILARLLREADRRFREEHQPDLIRRAGAHMGHLTGGRYDRMLVDDTTENGGFQLMGPALPGPIPLAHPISTGTLEQAYLALRLAIVDHLDRGGERLPLFVDEVFVNWDEQRRGQGMDLLASVAETRQIFFFTCHQDMAYKLRHRGAKLVALADDQVSLNL